LKVQIGGGHSRAWIEDLSLDFVHLYSGASPASRQPSSRPKDRPARLYFSEILRALL
jgi:hypothetical protein